MFLLIKIMIENIYKISSFQKLKIKSMEIISQETYTIIK